MSREELSHGGPRHLEGARYPDNLLKGALNQQPAASWEMLITTGGADTVVRYLLGLNYPIHPFSRGQ